MWPLVKFNEVVQISRGISYSSANLTLEGLGRPMINLRNVDKGGGFRLDGLKYYDGEIKERHRVFPGDLLIANTDLSKAKDVLGSPIVVPTGFGYEDAVFSLDLAKLSVNTDIATVKYVTYFLESPSTRTFMKENGSGTTIMHLRLGALSNLQIPLPSLDRQREIVEKLDSAFSEIISLEKNLDLSVEKTNHLLESLQREVLMSFDNKWKSGKLCDLGKWITGSTPSTAKKEFWGDDVPFVTPADLGANGELGKISRRISKLGSEQVRLVIAPSVLLVCIGATLGKVAWTNETITTNQQINTLQVDSSKSNSKFVMYLLSSPVIQKRLWDSSTGTTVPILNKGNLENIDILIPSLEEQVEIVRKLDSVFAQTELLKKTLQIEEAYAVALRESFLSNAFDHEGEVA